MMRIIIKIGLILIFAINFAHSQELGEEINWQADLDFLSKIIHQNYEHLFVKISSEEWDVAVQELGEKLPELDDHQAALEMTKLVALFGYGHTSLSSSGSAISYKRTPINIIQFADGFFIQGTTQDHQYVLGSKIIAIEGVPIDEVWEKIKPVFPAENEYFYKRYGNYLLTMPAVLHNQKVTKELKETVKYTISQNGTNTEVVLLAIDNLEMPSSYGYVNSKDNWLDARHQSTDPLYLRNLDKIYFMEYLPDEKVVYVRQSQVQNDASETLENFYQRVFDFIDSTDVEKLVLDVRLNGGGNNFLNKPLVKHVIRSDKINQAGKFFVIISGKTFSACQNLVNELDNYTEVLFVGEPTGENINFYGDNRSVKLPSSGMTARLSFAWWQDKPAWVSAPYTVPHVMAESSFSEYQNNQDPVLEAALDFNPDGFIRDPMQHITTLFMAGKIGQLQQDVMQMLNDPRYAFFDFEKEFVKAGNQLLQSGQVMEGTFVFGFVTQLFPKSVLAWNGMAHAHLKAGNDAKVAEIIEKLNELDGGKQVSNQLEEKLKKGN